MCGAFATSDRRAVEHRAREVEPLLDVDRERGAPQHGAHLLGDRGEAVVEELELDRVARRSRRALAVARATPLSSSISSPRAGDRAVHPGSTTVVPVASTTIAGPSNRRRLEALAVVDRGVAPLAIGEQAARRRRLGAARRARRRAGSAALSIAPVTSTRAAATSTSRPAKT